MTTDSCDACRSLDSHASSSLAAPTSPSFASSPSLLLPQTADQQKPTILQPQVLKPTNVQVCAGEVVSTTVSASANTNPSYPTHLTPHSLLSTTHATAGTTKEISNHSHKPEPQHSMNRSSYKDALVSTLPSHSSYSHSHPHLTSDSHEASHRHHSSSSSRRKRTYSDKDDDSIKSYKRSHHDRKRRSRSRGTRRDAYAPHHKYRRLHTRSPSHDRKASTSSTSYKSHRGNAKFESFSTSYRSRSISSVTPMQALPAKERLPRNPKFSDLPLEWWERGEACKEAKTDHVEKIDYLCKSREFLVLNTTLWTEDTMLELNMFPCKCTYTTHYLCVTLKILTTNVWLCFFPPNR